MKRTAVVREIRESSGTSFADDSAGLRRSSLGCA